MSLYQPLCSVLGHKPARSQAWWDGLDWRAPCRRCDKPMIRCVHEGWRLFRSSDATPDRESRDGYRERREKTSAEMELRLRDLHGASRLAKPAQPDPESKAP